MSDRRVAQHLFGGLVRTPVVGITTTLFAVAALLMPVGDTIVDRFLLVSNLTILLWIYDWAGLRTTSKRFELAWTIVSSLVTIAVYAGLLLLVNPFLGSDFESLLPFLGTLCVQYILYLYSSVL